MGLAYRSWADPSRPPGRGRAGCTGAVQRCGGAVQFTGGLDQGEARTGRIPRPRSAVAECRRGCTYVSVVEPNYTLPRFYTVDG